MTRHYRDFGPKPKGETNAEYLKRLRAWAVKQGLCYVCRKRKAAKKKGSCQVCLERARAYKEGLK